MDKRLLANKQVKEKIENAFVDLLNDKSIDEISITELVTRAGVARSSFYRNYGSMNDVMNSAIEQVVHEFEAGSPLDTVDFTDYAFLIYVFRFYYRIRRKVLTIFHAGISFRILQEIINFDIDAMGSMTWSSIDRYDIYYYSGALFSVVLQWLNSGAQESAEEMARKFQQLVINQS